MTAERRLRPAEMTDPALWERIQTAQLPGSKAQHSFARTLAYATDLPVFEAREVEEEYRRFLYLATVTDEARAPAPQVHQAWRLHAQSARYADFCIQVLGKPLPFTDAARKFAAATAYRKTLAAYVGEFGTRPPATVWTQALRVRVPRWLFAHAFILGFSGIVSWQSATPLYFAIGVALSLALYGLDLFEEHLSRAYRSFGKRLSDDLDYFLDGSGGR